MPSRAELNLRAAAVGFDPSTMPNDSKLEQKVLFLEKNSYAVTGTIPTTTLTSTGVAANLETITIGSVTYRLVTALTTPNVANDVLIGAAATNTLDNLKDAINGTAVVTTPGVGYSQNTVRHPRVTAGAKTATTLVVASTDTNTAGALATTKTAANFAFTGATLASGVLGAKAIANVGVTDSVGGVSGDRNTSL